MNDKYLLIGTAGHVDHGKTQLIHALTGISTDRLKEEKERGISIELGFAHFTLPNGQKAGVVDVPGHEKFVRQMLAGASGMNIVLLVIAADEGIMPQTREHLDILSLLNIEKGIIVLTKTDLVDQEWLDMVENEVAEELKDSVFKKAPICKVSTVTGDGIPELVQTLVQLLDETVSRRIDLPPRMAIDRIFTIQGFGTVVTGTLSTGIIKKGEDISIEPGGLVSRIRSIQVHGEPRDHAYAGQRIAVNLSGLTLDQIEKGSNLVAPGFFDVSSIVDVELANLPHENRAIKHRQRIHFHVGTTERTGRIHLLADNEVLPGKSAFAQVILDHPVLVIPGERFVIRYYSPVNTIGGGKILGAAPVKRRRFKKQIIEEFMLLASGDVKNIVLREFFNPLSVNELVQKTKLGMDELTAVISSLEQQNRLVRIKGDAEDIYWNKQSAEQWGELVVYTTKEYIENYPLRLGISREELKRILKLEYSSRRFQYLLEWGAQRNNYELDKNLIIPTRPAAMPEAVKGKIESLKQIWLNAGLNPPELTDACLQAGIAKENAMEYASYLVAKNVWVNIETYYFDRTCIEQAKQLLVRFLDEKTRITVAEARDLWQTSRKYTVPILEYFDALKITKRNDTFRILS